MKQKIEPGEPWEYVGRPPGVGMKHVVTDNRGGITTWSEFDDDPNNGGYAFHGTMIEFLKNFKPLEFSNES